MTTEPLQALWPEHLEQHCRRRHRVTSASQARHENGWRALPQVRGSCSPLYARYLDASSEHHIVCAYLSRHSDDRAIIADVQRRRRGVPRSHHRAIEKRRVFRFDAPGQAVSALPGILREFSPDSVATPDKALRPPPTPTPPRDTPCRHNGIAKALHYPASAILVQRHKVLTVANKALGQWVVASDGHQPLAPNPLLGPDDPVPPVDVARFHDLVGHEPFAGISEGVTAVIQVTETGYQYAVYASPCMHACMPPGQSWRGEGQTGRDIVDALTQHLEAAYDHMGTHAPPGYDALLASWFTPENQD